MICSGVNAVSLLWSHTIAFQRACADFLLATYYRAFQKPNPANQAIAWLSPELPSPTHAVREPWRRRLDCSPGAPLTAKAQGPVHLHQALCEGRECQEGRGNRPSVKRGSRAGQRFLLSAAFAECMLR
jgi:hypothetical protein